MASKESALRAKAQKALAKGDVATALASYQQLLRLCPDDARLWVNVGDLCARIGQKKTALDIYARAVDRYSREFRLEEAIRVCQKMLTLNPGDPRLQKRLQNLESRAQLARAEKRGNDTIHRWQMEQAQAEAPSSGDSASYEVEFGSKLPDTTAPPHTNTSADRGAGSDKRLLQFLAQDPTPVADATEPVTLDQWLSENPQGVSADDLFATTQELRRIIVEQPED